MARSSSSSSSSSSSISSTYNSSLHHPVLQIQRVLEYNRRTAHSCKQTQRMQHRHMLTLSALPTQHRAVCV
jgi:hypothetical protein